MIASRLPWTTVSGVRSSWLTSASRVRRWRSSASSRAAIVSKPRDQLARWSDRPRAPARRGPSSRRPRPGGWPRRARSSVAAGRPERPADRRRARRRRATRTMSPGSGPTCDRTKPAAATSEPGDDQEERARTGSRSRASVHRTAAGPRRAPRRAAATPFLAAAAPVPRPAHGRRRRLAVGRSSPDRTALRVRVDRHQSASRSSAKR